ncbi:hypothetical protein BZA05DRAFT_10899 [Tricharina praecox]|uniref:uncharacterized protein n=1 Tax=Tricharina praecox TaxID=43433 RepID=UPI00221F9C7C|nr:uncharacterized protein BZA05DRAFT_10899 [Tricharina praecox]KAI5858690.1 hypothetical protein BZA05DRAFT_10899 [Tricharina praecox]
MRVFSLDGEGREKRHLMFGCSRTDYVLRYLYTLAAVLEQSDCPTRTEQRAEGRWQSQWIRSVSWAPPPPSPLPHTTTTTTIAPCGRRRLADGWGGAAGVRGRHGSCARESVYLRFRRRPSTTAIQGSTHARKEKDSPLDYLQVCVSAAGWCIPGLCRLGPRSLATVRHSLTCDTGFGPHPICGVGGTTGTTTTMRNGSCWKLIPPGGGGQDPPYPSTMSAITLGFHTV